MKDVRDLIDEWHAKRLKIVEGATREAMSLLASNGDKWALYEAIETAFMASTYTASLLEQDKERFEKYLK